MNRLQGYSNHFQYQDLAVSLAKGKPYLEIEPSKEIKQMKNPYDFNYRQKLIEEKNAAFEWDRAYHEGKYYVYFGIVPAVLSYLPYYLITGMPLSNAAVIFIVSILTMLGIFLFLKEVVKRYFPKTSLLLFLLLFLFITMGSGLLGILSYATLYNVPIVFALAFTFFGLYFILSSIQKEKLCWWRILLGSCCMALVVGCRPQLFVGSFLLIPLLWEEVFKKRTLFSKKSIGQTFCFILPYLIVAILLMYYNKIRFGSVFDFGANYNITGNDMTRRGFIFDRIGLGVFSYLLQPMSIKATFPFLTKVLFNTNYMGITIHEPLFGGLLTCSPLLFLGVFFFKFKYYMPSKKLYYFNMGCIISAFLLVILDTQMAGILQRYFSDFAWLFYLPTIFIILSIANKKIDKKYLKLFLTLVVVFITVSFAYQFLLLFEDQFLHDLVNSSTDFFFKWYYLLQWWL